MKIFNDSFSVGKTGFNRTQDRSHGWLDGEIATPWGFVIVYAQGDDNNEYLTRLDFIHKGRQYVRSFRGKRFTQRGVKTKAMQFARELAG